MLESKFKDGSRAWSPIYGWGTVNHVDFDKDYTLQVVFDNGRIISFTKDGMQNKEALLPTLFLDEVKIENWPNPPAKLDPSTLSPNQEIEVKLVDYEGWIKRKFACFIYGQVFVCPAGKTLESSKSLDKVVKFRLPVN